ncbi:MAG TPA: hypothetical protein VMM13_16860, partial [Euzebya sp.]|nr:hypothetical protein [Euzebya sp.]
MTNPEPDRNPQLADVAAGAYQPAARITSRQPVRALAHALATASRTTDPATDLDGWAASLARILAPCVEWINPADTFDGGPVR